MNSFDQFSGNPAHNLTGLTIDSTWEVFEKVTKNPNATGGNFSAGYKIKNLVNGFSYFLKALDFSEAFRNQNTTNILQHLTTAYNFERDLLLKCNQSNLKRVLKCIHHGEVEVPGFQVPYNKVSYLILELAEGDIRSARLAFSNFDLAWTLRTLHHAAVGIHELHQKGIAHQDLKPSNLMQLTQNSFKITDMGRSHDINSISPFDTLNVPGDGNYAPPESLYKTFSTFNDRRLYDIFSIGGLIFFHFLNVSPTNLLRYLITKNGLPVSSGNYLQDLPSWISAFHEAIEILEEKIKENHPKFASEISQAAFFLCHPDITQRGHPNNLSMISGDKLSVERFISKFNLLAKKAEYNL